MDQDTLVIEMMNNNLLEPKRVVLFCFLANVTASAELYYLLEPLDEVQLSAAIIDCVEFCKHKLSADFLPLVEVLKVKNYKIAGERTFNLQELTF